MAESEPADAGIAGLDGGEGEIAKDASGFVLEYLQFHGLHATVEAFLSERHRIADDLAAGAGAAATAAAGQARDEACLRLVQAFDAGDRDSFFSWFERLVPAPLRRADEATRVVEFVMQTFFAIRPALATPPRPLAASMRAFKAYLESGGAAVASSGELLPLYALPYVPEPRSHASFAALFDPGWPAEARGRLEAYLASRVAISSPRPHLYALVEQHYGLTKTGGMRGGGGGDGDPSASLAAAFFAGEEPWARPPPPAIDGPTLTTGEADPGADEARGDGNGDDPAASPAPCSPSRPASVGVPSLGASLHGPLSLGVSLTRRDDDAARRERFLAEGRPPAIDASAVRRALQAGCSPGATPGMTALASRVLIALRQRVTRGPPGLPRRAALAALVAGDALGCGGAAPGLLPALVTASVDCAEAAARLVNVLASDSIGRSYLLRAGGAMGDETENAAAAANGDAMDAGAEAGVGGGDDGTDTGGTTPPPVIAASSLPPPKGHVAPPAVRALATVAMDALGPGGGGPDGASHQAALGALQKLSLRAPPRPAMATLGLLSHAVTLLRVAAGGGVGGADPGEGEGGVSDYTGEYAAALLMNLSLCAAGRRAACDPSLGVLSALNDLLASPSPQLRTYVHGSLYALLQCGPLRESAREMGLGEILVRVQRQAGATSARHIDFILRQLESEAPDPDDGGVGGGAPPGDDAEDDVYDEELDWMAESDADVHQSDDGGVGGEALLCADFLQPSAAAAADELGRAASAIGRTPRGASFALGPGDDVGLMMLRPVTPRPGSAMRVAPPLR